VQEILSSGAWLGGRAQSEERVVFDGAFPQMFARSFVQQTKDERVFLFVTLTSQTFHLVRTI